MLICLTNLIFLRKHDRKSAGGIRNIFSPNKSQSMVECSVTSLKNEKQREKH